MGNCICYLRKDEEGYPVPMSTMPIEGFEEFVCEGHLIAVKIPAIKNTGEERPGSRKMYVKLVSASKTMSCYESRTQTAPVYIIPLEAIHKVSKSGTKGLEVGLVGDWTFVFEAESLGEQMRWLLNLQEMLKKIGYTSVVQQFKDSHYWHADNAIELLMELRSAEEQKSEKKREKSSGSYAESLIREKESREQNQRESLSTEVKMAAEQSGSRLGSIDDTKPTGDGVKKSDRAHVQFAIPEAEKEESKPMEKVKGDGGNSSPNPLKLQKSRNRVVNGEPTFFSSMLVF
uniref:PH domain-containing protein n=1 Tax=Lotharella globosa TaxID=91324 RepID=A0A7S3Z4D4_9EUKA